jgi:hypothetical protein
MSATQTSRWTSLAIARHAMGILSTSPPRAQSS